MEASTFKEIFNLSAAGGDGSSPGRLLALLDGMMETAGRHAEKLGVGVRDLHAKRLTWVLARLHAKVSHIPPMGQTVHIATWPSGRHRLFAVREFRLSNEADVEILRATSAWALMNIDSRRPARLDSHLPVFSRHHERMIRDDFSQLPPVQQAGSRASYMAAAADIDLNDHVNNTVYLDWALRTIPTNLSCQQLISLEAAFLGEARLGDEIYCRSESATTDGKTIVVQSLQDAASGRELTRLRSSWES